jgi:hypothetical protein
MKKKLLPLLAYMVAFALIFSSVGVLGVPVSADDEDAEEEYEDEDEDEEDDEEDEGIAVVENFKATNIEQTSVDLKWDKVDDVDGYEITCNGKTVTTSKTKITIKKLKMNKKYTIKIRAYVRYEEDEEDETEELDDSVEIESDDDEYSDEDDSDSENEDYEYGEYAKLTIKTLNKNGEGYKSSDAAGTTKSSSGIKAVKKLKAKYINNSKGKGKTKAKAKDKANGVKLTWAKNSKAKGYYVYRAVKGKKIKYKKIANVKKKAFAKNKGYIDTKGLKAKQTYLYMVVAYKSKKVVSPESKAVSVKIPKKK